MEYNKKIILHFIINKILVFNSEYFIFIFIIFILKNIDKIFSIFVFEIKDPIKTIFFDFNLYKYTFGMKKIVIF